ncbi:DUF4326 domain-containing protein [Nonomuraea sp. NPDC046802]|uniref:DUF4326 domain-containing protein n=1 Tax=Nonomuraea sp. NPDC046802 TaxID=3154919 RepID=UPI0033F71078
MSHPLVVHSKRSHYDVYIGRPSKWGNPFVIGRDGNREQVIARYEQWLTEQPQLLAALHELTGKILGCWCAPRPCHGDVLARLANQNSRLECCTLNQQAVRAHCAAVDTSDDWPPF